MQFCCSVLFFSHLVLTAQLKKLREKKRSSENVMADNFYTGAKRWKKEISAECGENFFQILFLDWNCEIWKCFLTKEKTASCFPFFFFCFVGELTIKGTKFFEHSIYISKFLFRRGPSIQNLKRKKEEKTTNFLETKMIKQAKKFNLFLQNFLSSSSLSSSS